MAEGKGEGNCAFAFTPGAMRKIINRLDAGIEVAAALYDALPLLDPGDDEVAQKRLGHVHQKAQAALAKWAASQKDP